MSLMSLSPLLLDSTLIIYLQFRSFVSFNIMRAQLKFLLIKEYVIM